MNVPRCFLLYFPSQTWTLEKVTASSDANTDRMVEPNKKTKHFSYATRMEKKRLLKRRPTRPPLLYLCTTVLSTRNVFLRRMPSAMWRAFTEF